MAHVRKVHGPREQLSCEEEGCDGKTFKNIGALIYHKQKCHTEKAPCAVCGTTDYSILKNHMVSKHPKPCEPETCDQCGKVFTNKLSFKNHMKKGHTNADMVGSTMWGKAKLLSDYDKNCQCGLDLPSNIAKINHYKLFHLEYEQCEKCEKIVQSITDGHHKCAKPVKKPLAAPIVCNYCGKEFNSEGGISYHVKTVHLKETAECPICFKTYPKAGLSGKGENSEFILYHLFLPGHMAIHRPKTACDFCGKLVSRMREHMESMHQADSEMSYRCDLCGKGFPTSQKLRDHDMNVHLKLRPYTCR